MKEIPLTQGKVTLVDDADYEWLNQWKWCAQSNKLSDVFYAQHGFNVCPGLRKYIRMHRFILGMTDPKVQVDHRDRDGLNNQRLNLRVTDASGNVHNRGKIKTATTSKYIGVARARGDVKFRAQIRLNGVLVHLGCFAWERDAANAYDSAAAKHFGEFASLNFPSTTSTNPPVSVLVDPELQPGDLWAA